MRIVLSGASGFIGRRVAHLALERGAGVVALARDPRALRAGLDCTDAREWDLTAGLRGAPDALRGADAIIHCAAVSAAGKPPAEEAQALLLANAVGALRMVELAGAAGIARVVFVTAANAYRAQEAPCDEDVPLYPDRHAAPYLTSLVAAETLASAHGRALGVETVFLRASSAYGPADPPRNLVACLATKLLTGQAVRLDGGGLFAADFVYVDDVARACLAAVERGLAGAYNVASGEHRCLLDVVRILRAQLARSASSVEVVPADPAASPDRFPRVDAARLRRATGHAPTPLHEGIARTIAALRGAA